MAVYIPRADGNDRIARMNGREQIGGSSAGASVMRDLQQHPLGMLFHDAPFRRTFRVSLEQSGCPAKSGTKHQAIVVWPHQAGDLVASGSEHVEMHAAVIELIAFFFYRNFHSRSLGLCNR